ncbi:MAG: hypothetical protein JSU08_18755 [Acidobacteria bacterium]|nr:hypothetical protein [Acidobacteriota bacterium]
MRQLLISVPTVIIGGLLAGAAYWGLLNVPESNVPALLLSGVLGVLIVAIGGISVGTVLAQARGNSLLSAMRWSVRRLPAFVAAIVIFAALWWITAALEAQWTQHAGEVDAIFLRYVGTARTAWAHTGVSWLMWLLRWGLGLALVAAITAGAPGIAVASVPLGATIGGLLVGWLLWLGVYWRPRGLPHDTAELLFVSVKLGALVLIGTVLVVGILGVFARRIPSARG